LKIENKFENKKRRKIMSELRDALIEEGLPAADIEDSYTITWLDISTASIMRVTKIYVEDIWMDIGNINILDYPNTDQGRTDLEANVPDPYKIAVLTVWNTQKSS
jgi:hypothetical protein